MRISILKTNTADVDWIRLDKGRNQWGRFCEHGNGQSFTTRRVLLRLAERIMSKEHPRLFLSVIQLFLFQGAALFFDIPT